MGKMLTKLKGIKGMPLLAIGLAMGLLLIAAGNIGFGGSGKATETAAPQSKDSEDLEEYRKELEKQLKELIEKLEIKTPSTELPVRMLSGGNVQKVLLGREIHSEPDLLITAYPVRGLDINSSYLIYSLLNEQKKKNTAVLFIGEDLDVLLELCDRIMVLCHGKITGICDAKKVTKEQVGMMMTGSTMEEVLGIG